MLTASTSDTCHRLHSAANLQSFNGTIFFFTIKLLCQNHLVVFGAGASERVVAVFKPIKGGHIIQSFDGFAAQVEKTTVGT